MTQLSPITHRVGIITRTKDRPLLLRRAMDSVHGQSFKDYVWMIVNDGGESEPVDEIASAARRLGIDVHVVHHEASLGMEAASNAGINATNSQYLVIHDDDDSWHPDFLSECVSFLDNETNYGGVVTHTTQITEELHSDSVKEIKRIPYNAGLLSVYLIDLAQVNRFPPISFVFRRDLYDQVGGFDETLPVLGDWDFHLRLCAKADIGVIREPLAYYHIRNNSEGIYSNTVTGGKSLHIEYDAKIRNKLLREDLNRGDVGLGFLINIPRLFGGLRPLISILSYMIRLRNSAHSRVISMKYFLKHSRIPLVK